MLFAIRTSPPPSESGAVFQKPARCELAKRPCISGRMARTREAGISMDSMQAAQNLLLKCIFPDAKPLSSQLAPPSPLRTAPQHSEVDAAAALLCAPSSRCGEEAWELSPTEEASSAQLLPAEC